MSLISEDLLSPRIQRARQLVDEHLAAYSDFGKGCPPELMRAIQYCLLAPGKRIRPLLVLMATEACQGEIEKAVPAACAVEMIHTYSLVHDDLPAMDDDELRRGRPSCHIAFGEDVAILAGDALLARAFEILAAEVRPTEIAIRCISALGSAAGATKLVGGQADDLAGAEEVPAEQKLNWLQEVHHRKTGALLTASLEMGGIVGDSAPDQLAALKKYGQNLGLAFQIVDDLLDLCGNQAKIGKRIGSDQGQGKLTYPELLGIDESRRQADALIHRAISAVEIFGPAAEPLNRLARFVIQRNR